MSWIELVAQRRPQPPPGVTPPENAADWFRIENSADEADTTDIYVYDAVGGWYGMYADDFIRDLRAVSTSSINIRINSPGGSVFDGVAIANAIRSHPANVTCYVDSLAASIASVIALSGDRLVMRPQSMIMIHDASATVHGNAKDMQDTADLLDKTSDNLAGAYAAKAGGTVPEWRERMRAETWMTADEAVELGLADEAMPMLPKKGDDPAAHAGPEKMRTLWDLSAYRYAGRENAPAPAPVAITAQAPTPPAPPTPEPVILPSPMAGTTQGFDLFAQYTEQLTALVRSTVRAELAVVLDAVSPSHSTSVESGTWDAGANEKRLPSPVPVATVKKMYTYYDADKAEDGGVPKTACKLPHHFVSDDGTPGAASINGVRNALARLPQTQGLSDAERSAAEAHLNKHLAAFKGGEDDHLDDEDGAQPDAAVEDAKKKNLPPWIKPDEDEDGDEEKEEKETDDESESAPAASTDPPPDAPASTHNEADPWTQVVGFLVPPSTSPPSADDVFAQLKGAW
jgi:ATP-dependent protease ClpP protease subunit